MTIDIYCDGGARGNPGPAAIGIYIRSKLKAQSSINNRINKYIGIATNNQAEYRAVIEALIWLSKNLPQMQEVPEKINFYLDSKLVVNQLNGKYKVKNPELRELLLQVRTLEGELSSLNSHLSIRYSYIPREKNREADRLVNEALDKRE